MGEARLGMEVVELEGTDGGVHIRCPDAAAIGG